MLQLILDSVSREKCYGCGACVIACTSKALKLVIDERGFFAPTLYGKCSGCGKCEEVCQAIEPPEMRKKAEVFAAYTQCRKLRLCTASGGVATSLALDFVKEDGKVVGVKFSKEFRSTIHSVGTDAQSVLEFSGSKYVQSDPTRALIEIKEDETKKYLFFGTPCQVAGVKKLIEKGVLNDGVVLVDLFCHGVPSYVLWRAYLTYLQKKVGRIYHIDQRYKAKGWHSYYVRVFGSHSIYLREHYKDPFFFFYLNNYFLRNTCFNCPFRGINSCADIRLGDFWGEDFFEDEIGTSLVMLFTERGLEMLTKNKDVFLSAMPLEVVGKSQNLEIKIPNNYNNFLNCLKGRTLENALKKVWWNRIKFHINKKIQNTFFCSNKARMMLRGAKYLR